MKMVGKIKSKKMCLVFAQVAALGLVLVASSASATIHFASDETLWFTPNFTLNTSLNPNPGALGMYEYVPDTVPSDARYVGGVVVLLHGCQQDAAEFASESGWVAQADLHGFSIIAPQQSLDNNDIGCFNWFNLEDQTRGSGEPLSIIQMIDNFAERRPERFDADNVKVSGFSAGGGMAAVMLATYPDVFSGGAIMAGIPYKCAVGEDGVDAWNCMQGTSGSFQNGARQWGDLARNARRPLSWPAPCGSWFWPACEWPPHKLEQVSIFFGTKDGMVVPKNADALVKQWTNFLEVPLQATTSAVSIGGSVTDFYTYSHTEKNYCDTVYEVAHINGNHDVSIVDSEDGSCGRPGQDVKGMALCSTIQAMTNWGW